MVRSARRLVLTAVIAVSAILMVPALIEPINNLSYDATPYGQHLESLLMHADLLLALLALVMLASFILDT